MNPQLLYTLLFFIPFVLLLVFFFLIAKKIIKLGLIVFIIAVILFFVFSIKISPLDFLFRYGQDTSEKSINLGKYELIFYQTPGEKLYASYLKIHDTDTGEDRIIVLDPEGGKYWNVDIRKDGDNQCFYNLSKQLFCINTKDWTIKLDDKSQNINELPAGTQSTTTVTQ